MIDLRNCCGRMAGYRRGHTSGDRGKEGRGNGHGVDWGLSSDVPVALRVCLDAVIADVHDLVREVIEAVFP